MFRWHWFWKLLVLSADEFGCCCIQWQHSRGHGCCSSGDFISFGWKSYEFLQEVTAATVVENEYFEPQLV